ncbi:amidohydrolase family protein [Porticoccus sp. GXU_MW_L64]
MLKTVYPALLLLIFLAACSEQPPSQKTHSSFVVSGAQVFDGESSLGAMDVVVRDGYITELSPSISEQKWLGQGLAIIDGQGHTLLPGFIDAHTHTESVQQLADALMFGVTTILDMGTFPEHESALRHAAMEQKNLADFRSSGAFITAPGGHGTEYGITIPTLEHPEQADELVQSLVDNGADYLKLVINGVRHQAKNTPTLDEQRVRAVVKAGKNRNLLILAHIENDTDVLLALEAGVDGLVHHWRDAGARPELARKIADAGVFVMPSLAVVDGILGEGPKQLLADPAVYPYLSELSRKQLGKIISFTPPRGLSSERGFAGVRSLMEADVKLLMGSDAFVYNPRIVHGASFHRLLELFTFTGLTPEQVLQAATADAADTFALTDRGRIKKGLVADLVLVRGDPITDIRATRDIARVWRAGVELQRTSSE